MESSKYETINSEIEEAWQSFQKNEDFDCPSLRPEIYESWLRSREFGVDPYNAIPTLLPQDEFNKLLKDNLLMRQTALPFMRQIFKTINNSGCAVILSNKDCVLLEAISDESISSYANKIHSAISLAPGSVQSEAVIGTTEIALCIRHNRPIQVTGSEFFAEYNKKLSCIGAPLYDEHGTLIGILSVSMEANNFHKHSFGMIIALAEAITNEIKLKSSNANLSSLSALLQNTLEAVPQGLLVIDNKGNVIQMNSRAEQMLSSKKTDVINYPVDNFIANANGTVKFSKSTAELDQEMLINTPAGAKRFFVTMKFFSEAKNQRSQLRLITLRDTKTVSTFTNKIAAFQAKYDFCDIIGNSTQLSEVIQLATLAAKSSSTILITGESGSGKELFAQSIHNNSNRANGPFVSLNCGALPANLIESELFGYDSGAFTGARKGGQLGKFELAHQGTLFLDEIGDMPLAVQVSILRVLQSHEIMRVGGITPIPLDVRIIAATNKNLLEEVRNKKFREDLYYRLNVIHLQIPPLRERKGDIIDLANHFLKSFGYQLGADSLQFPPEVYFALQKYDWPGNIRELENFIERVVNTSMASDLDFQNIIRTIEKMISPSAGNKNIKDIHHDMTQLHHTYNDNFVSLQDIEKAKSSAEAHLISTMLDNVGGNVSKCAESLGITRRSLYRKMDEYNIDYKSRHNA